MRFFHLYHPRIVHLCNVKEVSRSKRLIYKSLIYLFYIFVSWFHPPSITSYLRENSKVQALEYHIEHQQQVLQLLKDNLMLAQNRMKRQANQHRNESSFDVADWDSYGYNHINKFLSSKLRRIINYHQSIMVYTRCCKR